MQLVAHFLRHRTTHLLSPKTRTNYRVFYELLTMAETCQRHGTKVGLRKDELPALG